MTDGANMEEFFNPKTVALIGATDRKDSVGLGIAKNLLSGLVKRKIFFINPNKKKILGQRVYKSIQDVPDSVDLAIIAVPSIVVFEAAEDCLRKKVKGAIIVSSGFSETGLEGVKREQRIGELFQKSGISFLGPNCLGIINPADNFNGSFAPGLPKKGGIAFISQSGALIDVLIDHSLTEDYGFSSMVSFGNAGGLDVVDFLEYFSQDEKTKVIVLYLEALKDGRKFVEAAKRISLLKPIVVLKAGSTGAGSLAAMSHSASLVGDSQVYSAAFRKAGVYEVFGLKELINVSWALSLQEKVKGGLGIITNAGALGVLAADACDRAGVALAKLTLESKGQLKNSKIMSRAMNFNNPLDIIGDALSDRYEFALKVMLSQENIGCCLVNISFQIMTDIEKIAQVVIEQKKNFPKKAVVCCLAGGYFSGEAVRKMKRAGIPVFQTPEEAVLAVKALCC